jgi:FkbH-like protein
MGLGQSQRLGDGRYIGSIRRNDSVNYLEAAALLRDFQSDRQESYRLVASGTTDNTVMYLRAHAARRGVDASVDSIPFGTLQQFLLADPPDEKFEIFLLTPWDFSPERDWRSGFPLGTINLENLERGADTVRQRLKKRSNAAFAYLPAPSLPVLPRDVEDAAFHTKLTGLAIGLGAIILDKSMFSLSAYLATGSLVDGGHLGQLTARLDDLLVRKPAGIGKVLVTDLDHVVWSGLAAEDGPDGVNADPEGPGYPHYIYQSFLKRLKGDGILLVAVSRNSPDDVAAVFSANTMIIGSDDFVSVVASYGAKSSQIKAIAAQLGLGLESFVFVDDNPVEIAEVSAALPEVTCFTFPPSEIGLPALLSDLARSFSSRGGTAEDGERTELYRRRMASMPPSQVEGADTQSFLADLSMELVITDRSQGDRDRAIQLINKTNQFNLNGVRFDDQEIGEVLASGGSLLTATLSDRMGTHGEVSALLISADGVVLAWVMSCRVFQRQVEYAFLSWLPKMSFKKLPFKYSETEKNLPIRAFISDPAFVLDDAGVLECNLDEFAKAHTSSLDLFNVQEVRVD